MSADIAATCAAAEAAFDIYRAQPLEARAVLLERIATEIMALGEELIATVMAESHLPRARLEGERGRTCGQLGLLASIVRAGRFLDLRHDPAQPSRQPAPRPDLRLRNIPLGPVAVFGASNFPLAFSVAGGDTASALAAGCPVVVKAHPAHPQTSRLVAGAIARAVSATGLPAGLFALVEGEGTEPGTALVTNPHIKAVGFTGSRAGGLALAALARTRPEPIPFYGELSAVNPVLLLPHALSTRGTALGAGFAASLTLGAGQFCTNPGLVLAIEGEGMERFIASARAALAGTAAQPMLTPGIAAAYERGVAARGAHKSLAPLANFAGGALFGVSAADFSSDPHLSEEIFGPAALLVRCASAAELCAVIEGLDGQLTATLHMDEPDHPLARMLLPSLERKAGRILANGWPTGVEVAHAMVHGGPFPATTESRTTSVGGKAIERFLRPVCYQDLPAALLPEEFSQNLPCLIDGKAA